jgi:hypothetical protein
MRRSMVEYKSYNTKTKHVSISRFWDLEQIAYRAAREPEKIFFVVSHIE